MPNNPQNISMSASTSSATANNKQSVIATLSALSSNKGGILKAANMRIAVDASVQRKPTTSNMASTICPTLISRLLP